MPPCVLITGGAGFIGFHAAKHFLSRGWKVAVLDSLARPGVNHNLEELKRLGDPQVFVADIREKDIFKKVFRQLGGRVDCVIHLAAQVAVTSSVKNPRQDLEINLLSTFELLETLRRLPKAKKPRLLIFSSTNKVYGDLSPRPVIENETRFKFLNGFEAVSEREPLDFHSPYGCSKGAADQYVHDYSRIYGLPTVVLRQSCIFGPQQFGIEDQGWVAYFGARSIMGKPITIYGTGKQVRDVLYVDDLIRLFDLAFKNANVSAGKIYNVGGGLENTLSLLELIERLQKKLKIKLKFHFKPWRPGDQKIFIADITALKNDLRWYPKVSIDAGLDRMLSWLKTHLQQVKEVSK